MGDNDLSYLLARAIQVFAPGIPQIYYVGLLAGKNDIKLLEETKEGRNINRHYYSVEEIKEDVSKPVVANLLKILEFRNTSQAFDLEGTIMIDTPSESQIIIERTDKEGASTAILKADLETKAFTIHKNGLKIFEQLAETR
ncbi:sucrose phosphorylase [Alkalibacterium subtropicum]|uniref:Sucrose phosphorylase n=1 Tax=Alkalibacterium subtropicum TaxID=753702 RepID=A0A1I1GJ96_9LACT|nr:sucrose phosphorylase [Alkalibacterium subtropicum]